MSVQEKSNNRIAKNTLLLYFRQILIMGISLYTVRVVLNALGVTDFGLYNVVAGFVSMFSFLSGAMSSASQRYFAYDIGKEDNEHLKVTFSQTLSIYFCIVFFAIFFAETIGLWFITNKLSIPYERKFAVNCVYQFSVLSLAFTIMTSPYMADIVAHEDMNIYAYVSIVEVFLKLGVAFFVKFINFDKLILYGLLLFIVTIVNTTIYRIICKIKYSECKFRIMWDREYAKEMFNFTGWSLFGALVGLFKNQLINILLNQFFEPAINATRSIANSVNSSVNSFSQNFSTALKPQIIKLYAKDDIYGSVNLTFRGCKFTYFLMLVFTVPLIFNMETVLYIWLGTIPTNAILFTRLALLDALIESVSYPIMALNQATGKIRVYQLVVGGILLLNFPISWVVLKLGMPAYSVYIVALVVCFFALILRVLIVYRQVKFSMKMFFTKVLGRTLVVTLFSTFLVFFFHKLVTAKIIFGLINIIIDVLIVSLFIIFIGFDKDEKKLVAVFFKKKLLKIYSK